MIPSFEYRFTILQKRIQGEDSGQHLVEEAPGTPDPGAAAIGADDAVRMLEASQQMAFETDQRGYDQCNEDVSPGSTLLPTAPSSRLRMLSSRLSTCEAQMKSSSVVRTILEEIGPAAHCCLFDSVKNRALETGRACATH